MSTEQLRGRSPLRKRASRIQLRLRSRGHVLPDVLILGAQKCGTTSLFNYLADLPGFLKPTQKELHFFDSMRGNRYRELGLNWYKTQFPRRLMLAAANAITGEASPTYMLEPLAMNRIAQDLPDSKWIVVLRDPSERAFSQFSARTSLGRESKTFEETIDPELTRLRRQGPKQKRAGSGSLFVQRGHFADQLAHLGALRPDKPTLVLFSENLFAHDAASFNLFHEFIGLPGPQPEAFPHENASAEKSEMDPGVRAKLAEHFAEVNASLDELLRSAPFLTIDPSGWPDWVNPERR